MIIQALSEYYEAQVEAENKEMPLFNFSRRKVSFAVVIDMNGALVGEPLDLRDPNKKKPIPVELEAPEEVARTRGIVANFLCDSAEYVLGISVKDEKKAAEKHKAFIDLHHLIGDSVRDDGMKAVLRFLDTWKPSAAKKWKNRDEIAAANIVFKLDGKRQYVHESAAVQKAWKAYRQSQDAGSGGISLVTGEAEPVARIHGKIKGIPGAQTSGAALISFNKDAFNSYGKDQNYNAPMSEYSAFAYTTVLNYLLRFESRQKVRIGAVTAVFWTEKPSSAEGMFAALFDDDAENTAGIQELRTFLEAVSEGKKLPGIDPDMKFYILGLSPNAARLSVRFWYVNSIREITARALQYLDDIHVIKEYDSDPDVPSMWRLLKSTAVLEKSDNIRPVLAERYMSSVISGAAFPEALLQAVIGRIRADRRITYTRASLLKAYLVRKNRIYGKKKKEVSVALDVKSKEIPYLLGRLFAVMEYIQLSASPSVKATIKDKFFGSALAMPARVYPRVVKLSQHHLTKLDSGKRVYADRLMQEITDEISVFPQYLALEDQGKLILGYYHQKKELYTSKKDKGEGNE